MASLEVASPARDVVLLGAQVVDQLVEAAEGPLVRRVGRGRLVSVGLVGLSGHGHEDEGRSEQKAQVELHCEIGCLQSLGQLHLELNEFHRLVYSTDLMR